MAFTPSNDFGGYDIGSAPVLTGGVPSSQSSTSSGTSTSQGTSSPVMIPGMESVYNQLLGINQGHYQNVMGAYQQGQNMAANQLPGIYDSYSGLTGQVENTLGLGGALGGSNWGVAQPAETQIEKTFAAQQGQTTQQMTDAGLGNTTVKGNLGTQNAAAAGLALGGLGAQLAQTAAGYEGQIGQAGLASRMQGLGIQTGLAGQAMGPMGQQFSNTAGALSGQSSQQTSSASQQSRSAGQGGQTPQQNGQQNPNANMGGGNPTIGAGGQGSGGGGSGVPGVPGYNFGGSSGGGGDVPGISGPGGGLPSAYSFNGGGGGPPSNLLGGGYAPWQYGGNGPPPNLLGGGYAPWQQAQGTPGQQQAGAEQGAINAGGTGTSGSGDNPYLSNLSAEYSPNPNVPTPNAQTFQGDVYQDPGSGLKFKKWTGPDGKSSWVQE
jgi:hypothetical protein